MIRRVVLGCRGSRRVAALTTAAHGLFSPATDQRPRARLDLRPDRHRLHHGLWHRRHDQFPPWRYLHHRRPHPPDHPPDPRPVPPHRHPPPPPHPAPAVPAAHPALPL